MPVGQIQDHDLPVEILGDNIGTVDRILAGLIHGRHLQALIRAGFPPILR